MKKKPAWLNLIDTVARYWQLTLFFGAIIFGFIWTCAVVLPGKVEAQDKRIDQVESRQQTIEQYIEATEEQKKLIQQSPPGWQWSEEAQQYVEWKDDPRLKKK